MYNQQSRLTTVRSKKCPKKEFEEKELDLWKNYMKKDEDSRLLLVCLKKYQLNTWQKYTSNSASGMQYLKCTSNF